MSLPENETPVCFPLTMTEFNQLIDDLMEEYALDNRAHAVSIVSMRIQLAPADQMETTMEDFGRRILKDKAKQLAKFIGDKEQEKLQLDNIGRLLKADPNNQELVDYLEKAVNAGSEYAKAVMAEIFPPDPCQVLTMSHLSELDDLPECPPGPCSEPLVSPGPE